MRCSRCRRASASLLDRRIARRWAASAACVDRFGHICIQHRDPGVLFEAARIHGLSGSLASFDAENEIRVRDRALGIGAAAGYGFELGSLLLELGGRADAMLVYQAIDRPDEARILANVGVEERDRSAFVPSASLLLGSKLAIVDELIAGVEARAGAAWIPMEVGARVRPIASARITLAWRF